MTSRIEQRDVEKLDHVTILRKRAEEYKKTHRIEDAMALNSRAAAIEKGAKPKNYWRDTGLCLFEIGRYEEAIECFDKDLQLNGDGFETYYAKGIALYGVAIYHEALECLYKAYEIKYEEKLKNEAKVDSLKSHKKFEEVLKYFGKETQSSQDYLLWNYLALTLSHLGRYKEATENFEKAAKMSNEPSILYNWAKCELMLNHITRCYELLEIARNHDAAISKMLLVDPAFDILQSEERFRVLLEHKASLM